MATKRKDATSEAKEERQETPVLTTDQPARSPAQHELEADPTLTDSFGIWIGKRSDSMWALVASVDGKPVLTCGYTTKRMFLRDYHRALERLGQLVFGGAIRSIR
jgi:hypothetical protein